MNWVERVWIELTLEEKDVCSFVVGSPFKITNQLGHSLRERERERCSKNRGEEWEDLNLLRRDNDVDCIHVSQRLAGLVQRLDN